jgi:hypothetical protein
MLLVTCAGPGTSDVWKKSLDILSTWMINRNIDPELQFAILVYLDTWRTGHTFLQPVNIQLNNLIGKQEASRRLSKHWTSKLIKKLWDVVWDLWEHKNEVLHCQENVVTQSESRILDRKVIKMYNQLCLLAMPEKDMNPNNY